MSSCREDVDVRTLGKGRPFAVELIDPHRIICTQEEVNKLQKLINVSTSDIFIRDLQMVTKDQLLPLKEGEEEKTKNYSALCVVLDGQPICNEELAKIGCLTDMVVMQKTPLRVLHRYTCFYALSQWVCWRFSAGNVFQWALLLYCTI